MNNLEFMWNLSNLQFYFEVFKLIEILIFTNVIFIKICDIKEKKIYHVILKFLSIIIISIVSLIIKKEVNLLCSLIWQILAIAFINSSIYKIDYVYMIIISTISYSINYIFYIITLTCAFIVASIFRIENDIINFTIIFCINAILVYNMCKINKLKHGFGFLREKLQDSYQNILILNIAINSIILIVILQNTSIINFMMPSILIIILAISMFITISQSFKLYYRHRQLEKNFADKEKEVDILKEENQKLKEENIKFSKTSHSLDHRIKALEYRIEKEKEVVGNKNIKNELKEISDEAYKEPENLDLPSTDIETIDNMLKYMQSECIKDKIKFDLQIIGNIHYMVNHLINEKDLEIMLADHIKDAKIAIDSSDNINRSILVRLGKIENIYSIYIYDSGIEFPNEIIEKLGKEPITTHKNNGGTGMGFMTTLGVLKECKASLIIKDIGKPSKDNYTKVIMIKFDNKNEFKKIG